MSENSQTPEPNKQGSHASETGDTGEKTVADQVELATKALVAGADTSEFSEAVLLAAEARKTNLELTQRAERAEAQTKKFQEKVEKVDPYTLLTDEQKTELESLKANDVEAYFKKRTEYETAAKGQINTEQTQQDVTSKLEAAISLHNARNPNMPFSMETLDQDIPLRLKNDITEKLNSGVISPADAVNAVAEFLSGSKKVAATEAPTETPNLSDAPGGAEIPAGTKVQDPNDYRIF